jgi:hypothetical protein
VASTVAPLAPSEDSELRALLESVRARTLQEASRRVGNAAAPGLHAGLQNLSIFQSHGLYRGRVHPRYRRCWQRLGRP